MLPSLVAALSVALAAPEPDVPPADGPGRAEEADPDRAVVPPAHEAAPAEDADDAAPTDDAAPDLRLLYTGGSGGIGSGTYRFDLLDRFRTLLADSDGSLDRVRAHHGAMAHGDWLLLANDRHVATLAAFLAATEAGVRCEEPTAGRGLRTRSAVLLLDDAAAPGLFDVLGEGTEALSVRACRAGEAKVWLYGPADAPIPDAWSRFEFRLGMQLMATVEGQPNLAELVGRPDEGAARRVAVLTELKAAHPDALFVDAGSFVDGTSSVRDNALSLHRPTGFEVLRRLQPTALAPGRTELAGGARAFLAEAGELPYVATNWIIEDPELALPPVRTVTHDGRTIAFLAAVDPAVARWVPRLAEEGVQIGEPLAALQGEVDRLRADDPPDLIVVLTELQGEALRTLRQGLRDVDLIVGDTAPELDRVGAVDVTLRPSWAAGPPPAYTVPLDGIGLAGVDFAGDLATRLHLSPRRVTPGLDPDADVLARVNAVRLAEYPPLDRPLVPAPPEAPTTVLPHETWEKVVCEAVLAYTDADVALLPALPEGAPVPGPLTELLTVDRLAILDVLEVHDVLGDAIPRMLNKAYEVVPVACGAPLGERSPTIAGRAVEPDRRYTVVTTDRIRTNGAIEGLITEGRPTRILDQPNHHTVVDDGGEPVTLRRAVLEQLRGMHDSGGDDLVTTLTARSPSDKPPQWTLRARPISFSVERFDGADDPAYAAIPETLATSPSSLTLATNDDLQLEYSSRGLIWDARARASFTKLTTEGETTEPADDLKLSTSASLPGAAFRLGPSKPMPFLEALYDSEFTPIENAEDGTLLPLQRDLSLTLGLSGSAGLLKTVRLGAFALRDLSVPEKDTEYGARTEIYARVGLGPGLYWGNQLDAYLWADTEQQDTSDLRFKALLDSRIELPLAWWLHAAVYGRAFVFQGRVPETEQIGASWTLGAALDFAGAFQL